MAAWYNHFNTLPLASDEDIPAMVARLEAIFLAGSPPLIAAGTQWYADRQRELTDISLFTAIPVEVLAYVASALSPQTQWRDNMTALYQTLDGWVHQDKAPVRSRTLYAINDAKAFRILQAWDDGLSMGTIVALLGQGPKTQAFARNLQGLDTLPDGSLAVTVDSITYQAATGTILPRGIRGRRYQRIITALSFLARKYGLPVYVLQAIIWTVYRQTGA